MKIFGTIESIEEWYCSAPPKSKNQWKDGYSAKEFAKMWFKNESVSMPKEITDYIQAAMGNFEAIYAIPEYETNFDDFGNGRHHDMFILCKKKESEEKFVVCIEAKVEESLGKTVEDSLKNISSSSNIPQRMEGMKNVLNMTNVNVSKLRYQLFTGSVGTLCEAKKQNVDKCLFIVLQIVPQSRKDINTDSTHKDFEEFVKSNGAEKVNNADNTYILKTAIKNIKTYIGYLRVKR